LFLCMKKIKLFLGVLFFAQMLLNHPLIAQVNPPKALWRVETRDGNVYFGRIESQNQEELRLQTENLGIITIKVADLLSMEESQDKAEVFSYHRNPPRFFLLTNGYNLKKGEGHYQNILIFFSQASYGFTDYFSLGIGTVPLFLFAGTASPFWITPKFSIPIKENSVNLGVGGLVGTIIGDEGSGTAGLAYGTLTLGSRSKNLSIGLGYGLVDGELAETPLFTIAGMYRLGEKFYLMSENFFVVADGTSVGSFSIGGRTVWDTISLDYGLGVPLGELETFIFFPWLGITIPFGSAR
ncbi:MAG: hypothetical protein ACOCW4_01875, partial [bacterium]